MAKLDYLEDDLRSCKLCEWRCGVDRLAGEDGNTGGLGVCGSSLPLVASSQLHPAPPASFDAFLTGCNFRCLFCQNWSISMFNANEHHEHQSSSELEGYYDPQHWAELALACLGSEQAQFIGADRLFFTGGEPTCSLPWIEEVVRAARQIIPTTKVNFDTNGFLTKSSLERVLDFSTSITYDLKAYNPELFRALTGAYVKPVLRNLKYIIKNAPDKLWELRVMVIPGVHENDMLGLCKFLADLDPEIKINFLAFRPNFVMEDYFGAPRELLHHCLTIAAEVGLKNATMSGQYDLGGKLPNKVEKIIKELDMPEHIALPIGFARWAGCIREPRDCGACPEHTDCPIKRYQAKRFK